MHSYYHNIKTFNNATRHLTRVERALYRDAIELYYDTESPLVGDVDVLARRLMAHTTEEKNALIYILLEFFELTGDVYSHDFCDNIIEEYQTSQANKAKAGRASALAREEKAKARKKGRKKKLGTGVEQALNSDTSSAANHEPENTNQKPSTTLPAITGTVADIFDYWCKAMAKGTTTKLTAKRKKGIQARLKEGYTVEEIQLAIDNCRADPWSMGSNDRNTPFNDLELICRSGEKLEFFIEKTHSIQYTAGTDGSRSTRDISLRESLEDTSWATDHVI